MDGPLQMRSGAVDPNSPSSRAQKHDDEKRRIIDSCFNKKDEEGNSIESYITHLRIIEDGAYPSGPAPPNSPPDTKKARLIIVAVRKSGRVRLHKARENNNGTFSIGKTWPIDDLTAVRSYSRSIQSTPEEEQQMAWAAGVGFTVTLGKTYYWQANAPKEKQFFIASIVKIFNKYTGGKYPQLSGFDDRELEQLLGPKPQGQQQSIPTSPLPTSPYTQQQNRPPRREPSREPLRQQSSREPLQRPSAGYQNHASSYGSAGSKPPPSREGRAVSPNFGKDFEMQGTSQSNLRRLASSNPSQDSFSTDTSSLPPRSRGGINGTPSGPGRFPDRSMTPTSQRTMTPEAGISAKREQFEEVPPIPAPLAIPPERRRPPIPPTGDFLQRAPNSSESFVPAPLTSPGMRRDDLRPPTRGSENSLTRSRGDLNEISIPIESVSESKKKEVGAETTTTLLYEQSTSAANTQSLGNSNDKAINPPPEVHVKQGQGSEAPTPSVEEEETRPGLGPMIKKRTNAANTFLKAARAAKTINAFKPRAGGAAERLREAQSKPTEGPDGITGVVPAPLLRGMSDDSLKSGLDATTTDKLSEPTTSQGIPEVKIILPQNSDLGPVVDEPKQFVDGAASDKSKAREIRRQKPPAETMEKDIRAIGVDPGIVGDKGTNLVSAWEDFGFVGSRMRTINVDQMQEQVQRELDRIQTGSDFLKFMDEQDDRVTAVHKGLDATIEACEELEALLTLYLVELDTLTPDIAYIEAQSQGLQVQAANQKLLQAELKTLLDTISISSDQLACLREASLESTRGLEQIETSLVLLFKAMVTIEPTLSLSTPRISEESSISSGKPGGYGASEIGSMRVLQEKKDVYRNESALFLRRLKTFLQVKFAAAVDETRKVLEMEKSNNLTRAPGKAKLDSRNHDLARQLLWRYSPLMLFSRDVDRAEWEDLLKNYEFICKSLYQNEFKDAIFAWKRVARKPAGDEADILFTAQAEKQTEGIATTARKLTVKRSQTLAKSLRSPGGDTSRSSEKVSDGRLHPYEVFAGVLDEVIPIITMEQNFVVEFFHMSSLEQYDFPEAVSLSPPDQRKGKSDLRRAKVMDPNRDLARQVVQSMEDIYSFFPTDLQALVDWAVQADPLQGVGVIAAIERKAVELEETSQEYLSRTLAKLHSRLLGLFNKFIDDQIRAIEETKVKINKRKGVIAFIRIFPSFSIVLETMLASAQDLEIRTTVNNAYVRINKTMFESLKVIARENPAAQTGSADPEDKEALNFQILLIENMNHYLEEVDPRSNPILEEWKYNATQEMDEHLNLYLSAVIRRPLGKLLDFIESTESLMLAHQTGDSFSKIAAMPSHSKLTFKKVLANYDSKEIRKGIEQLKRRVEKHFGDADEVLLSRGLVTKVLGSCEKFYEKVEERILTISRDIYEGEVVTEWTKSDVAQAFKSR